MRAAFIAKAVLGSILIVHGIVWTIMFPKSSDLLSPDFVLSAGIGVGCVVSGLLVFRLTRSHLWATLFGCALLWSLIFNGFLTSALFSQHNAYVRALDEQRQALARLTAEKRQ